jgi:hypothetical protein
MKTLVSALAIVTAAFVGCRNDFTPAGRRAPGTSDPLVVRAHFIGADQLLKDPNGSQLKEIWNLKSSADLRNRALDQFARLPFLWLSNSLPKNSPDQSTLFRALFTDALAHESFLEWRAAPVVALAARLPEPRAKAWDNNLRQVIANWKLGTPAAVQGAGLQGWEVSRMGAPPVRFVRAGDWVAITIGHGAADLETNILTRLKSVRPGGAWLEGEANLAQFKGRLPALENFSTLPTAHFSLSNRSDFVRTLVRLDFPKPHNWKTEPWQIPTNVIWDPLADFTVARGISGVLDSLPFISELGWKPTPTQITGWGSRDLPFQIFYAAPTRDVTNQLKKAESKVRASLIRAGGTNLLGHIVWDTNRSQVAWRGLPLAVPTLTSITNTPEQFVAVEFFPMIKTKQPPPRELFEQFFGRDDVVMYDWESTQYRIPTWRQMYQLAEIATGRRLSATNAPSERWQTEVASVLKDSITEVRATSPTQMTLVRKSTLGLTAFELVTLSRWIESASFPGFGVFPEQPPKAVPPRGTPAPKNR